MTVFERQGKFWSKCQSSANTRDGLMWHNIMEIDVRNKSVSRRNFTGRCRKWYRKSIGSYKPWGGWKYGMDK